MFRFRVLRKVSVTVIHEADGLEQSIKSSGPYEKTRHRRKRRKPRQDIVEAPRPLSSSGAQQVPTGHCRAMDQISREQPELVEPRGVIEAFYHVYF